MFLNENIGNTANQKIINNICEPASDKLENMPSPRVIKSHLALSMLPTDIKVVKPKVSSKFLYSSLINYVNLRFYQKCGE